MKIGIILICLKLKLIDNPLKWKFKNYFEIQEELKYSNDQMLKLWN